MPWHKIIPATGVHEGRESEVLDLVQHMIDKELGIDRTQDQDY